jgi:hypothetical protein
MVSVILSFLPWMAVIALVAWDICSKSPTNLRPYRQPSQESFEGGHYDAGRNQKENELPKSKAHTFVAFCAVAGLPIILIYERFVHDDILIVGLLATAACFLTAIGAYYELALKVPAIWRGHWPARSWQSSPAFACLPPSRSFFTR